MEVRFAECAFDSERRQVFRAGQEVHLSRKAFDLLGILIASQPRVVSKSELLERLWPATFVVEGNLSNLVAEVRSALQDDAQNPRFVRTAHGLGYAETLTGFKWISRVEGLRYGYEEAIGYCVDPDSVRDKDGVSAALLVAELAATLKAEGRTLLDLLDDIAREHGLHATDQLAARFDDLGAIEASMALLREKQPTSLGGRAVTSAEDLAKGDGGLPPTDGLRYHLEGNGRVIVRPSGTEPKVKCYIEVVKPVLVWPVTGE